MKKCVLASVFFAIALTSRSQVTWDGAGDGTSWNDALNWVGDIVPSPTDQVLLDNSVVGTAYVVNLPAGAATISVLSLTMTASGINTITLNLPVTNTANPGLSITGTGDALVLNNNTILRNSSGAAAGPGIAIINTFRINNGGHYIHNTTRVNAAIVSQLSIAAGTELGVFEFDVPGAAGYTPSLSGRNFGSLILSGAVPRSYAGSGASNCTVRGNFTIRSNVTFSISMTASFIVQRDYTQAISSVFNLQSSGNNNVVRVAGDLMNNGTITESGTGLPVLELNGTAVQQLSGTGGVTNSVTVSINNAAGINLTSPLSLPYLLNLVNGKITTSSAALLVMNDGAVCAGGSVASFINGPLKKLGDDPFVFPVGKGTIYAPVSISGGTGAAITDEFTAEYFRSSPQAVFGQNYAAGINHISSVEYWRLERNAGTSSKIVALDVHPSSFCIVPTTTFVSWFNGFQWTNEASSANGFAACGIFQCGTISTNAAVNSFGAFSLATSDPFQTNPLPLKLTRFRAERTGNRSAHISWETAEYPGRDTRFEVERSIDGANFVTINIIMGVAGTRSYFCRDTVLENRITWYRLKIIDGEGNSSYSGILRISHSDKGKLLLSVAPNPVSKDAVITLSIPYPGLVSLELYDMSGRLIKCLKNNFVESVNMISFNVSELPAGVYQLMARSPGDKAVFRFLKQ